MTTTTTTTIRTTPTQTTILTSMLFNSETEDLTETSETLEEMLFKGSEEVKDTSKSTPRLPKVSQDSFETTTTEVSVKAPVISVTRNVTVGITSTTQTENIMQKDQPAQVDEINLEHFEYVENGIEEDKKYLESAIGVPHAEESEPNEITTYHEDAETFDELLARTQESTFGKNARSLDLNHGYNGGALQPKLESSIILFFSCYCCYTVRWMFG